MLTTNMARSRSLNLALACSCNPSLILDLAFCPSQLPLFRLDTCVAYTLRETTEKDYSR